MFYPQMMTQKLLSFFWKKINLARYKLNNKGKKLKTLIIVMITNTDTTLENP